MFLVKILHGTPRQHVGENPSVLGKECTKKRKLEKNSLGGQKGRFRKKSCMKFKQLQSRNCLKLQGEFHGNRSGMVFGLGPALRSGQISKKVPRWTTLDHPGPDWPYQC